MFRNRLLKSLINSYSCSSSSGSISINSGIFSYSSRFSNSISGISSGSGVGINNNKNGRFIREYCSQTKSDADKVQEDEDEDEEDFDEEDFDEEDFEDYENDDDESERPVKRKVKPEKPRKIVKLTREERLKMVDEKENPDQYYQTKWQFDVTDPSSTAVSEETEDDYNQDEIEPTLSSEPSTVITEYSIIKDNLESTFKIEGIELTEDRQKANAPEKKKSEEDAPEEFDERELFNMEIQSLLIELEEEMLDLDLPLLPYIKYEIYDLHKDDPSFWDVNRLSKVFNIHPGRIVALIRFVEIEKIERKNGTYDEELNLVLEDYDSEHGYRMDDEGRDIDHDENQKRYLDEPGYVSAYGKNANKFKRGFKTSKDPSNSRPDPIHEIPTQIPESYPEKPIYFRGPTFVVPRKKNVVFVDTSRNPITKKVNPDPMVLIQGIDGSLRTPSSNERASIMQKVRPQRVKRDYNSVLNSVLRYKYSPKLKHAPKPKSQDEKKVEQQE